MLSPDHQTNEPGGLLIAAPDFAAVLDDVERAAVMAQLIDAARGRIRERILEAVALATVSAVAAVGVEAIGQRVRHHWPAELVDMIRDATADEGLKLLARLGVERTPGLMALFGFALPTEPGAGGQ